MESGTLTFSIRALGYKCPHTAFIDACQRAGIKDLRLHDLRHTYASRLVSAGASLYKVSTLQRASRRSGQPT
jgi:integrase